MEQDRFLDSLRELLEHCFSSPLLYLTDSTPHLGSLRAAQVYRHVRKIIQEDLEVVAALSNWLYQEGNISPSSTPPIDMASEHYVDLEYLLGELISFKKTSVEFFAQALLEAPKGVASTRLTLWVAQGREHLKQLEVLHAETNRV